MIYRNMNSDRIRICVVFLTAFYIVTYCGCSSADVFPLSPEAQDPGFASNIKSIELFNGKEIDCENKLMKIEKDSGSAGIVIVQTADTIKAGSAGFSYKSDWNELRIPLEKIRNFQIYDTTETDFVSGTVIVLGVAFVGLIIAGAVILSK